MADSVRCQDITAPQTLRADEVKSPSLSDSTALARFEFETGKGNEGTKILMVEWEDDDSTRGVRGNWHISWNGKSTVLPADDRTHNDLNRIYFLLSPGSPVPPTVTLIHKPADRSKNPVVLKTTPLPAIFSPELGASAGAAGRKGVLHTEWGKKRLSVLQQEIEAESRRDVESVWLQMALQEREWIEQNFGLAAKPASIMLPLGDGFIPPLTPSSPSSPSGGRLMDKLKGLRLGTSESDLRTSSRGESTPEHTPFFNPLSPEPSGLAISSFASLRHGSQAEFAATRTTLPASVSRAPEQYAQPPLIAQRQQCRMASLNAFADPTFKLIPAQNEDEDDLFALPISPRSPDMAKSPFSFKTNDTLKYINDQNG